MTTIKENGIYKAKIKTKENGLNILSMVENPASTQPFTRLDEQGKPININTNIKVKADVLETDISDKQQVAQRNSSK